MVVLNAEQLSAESWAEHKFFFTFSFLHTTMGVVRIEAIEKALIVNRMSQHIMANSKLRPELAKELARKWMKYYPFS